MLYKDDEWDLPMLRDYNPAVRRIARILLDDALTVLLRDRRATFEANEWTKGYRRGLLDAYLAALGRISPIEQISLRDAIARYNKRHDCDSREDQERG